MVLQAILCVAVLTLPLLVGSVFRFKSISLTYLMGQICMWAAFQAIGVCMVQLRAPFTLLFWLYTALVVGLTAWGVRRRLKVRFRKPRFSVFLILALLVIAFQCYMYIFRQHIDEDDARWIAEANDALVKNRMLLFNPATGEYIGRFTGEMIKDAFSPWAFYVAWMSRATGVRAVEIAHTVYPPVLLALGYTAYWEIGCCLFKKRPERGIFLLMVAAINLFFAGNGYTQSVFTLTRIWQGKAVIAGVMIPAILACILRIQVKDSAKNWLCLVLAGMACCLFSGMGIAIGVLMIAVYGFCALACKPRLEWKAAARRIPLWLLSMTPGLVFGLAYFWLKG